jgi:hypothetical protein
LRADTIPSVVRIRMIKRKERTCWASMTCRVANSMMYDQFSATIIFEDPLPILSDPS